MSPTLNRESFREQGFPYCRGHRVLDLSLLLTPGPTVLERSIRRCGGVTWRWVHESPDCRFRGGTSSLQGRWKPVQTPDPILMSCRTFPWNGVGHWRGLCHLTVVRGGHSLPVLLFALPSSSTRPSPSALKPLRIPSTSSPLVNFLSLVPFIRHCNLTPRPLSSTKHCRFHIINAQVWFKNPHLTKVFSLIDIEKN